MNDYMYLFTVFIAMGAVTAAERLLPFACSSWLRKQRWVGVVGNFLPLAIMVLLVLHASTGSALARGGLPVPEAAGVFLTLIVQWFVKKPLLSIFAGTAVYVILVNSLLSSIEPSLQFVTVRQLRSDNKRLGGSARFPPQKVKLGAHTNN